MCHALRHLGLETSLAAMWLALVLQLIWVTPSVAGQSVQDLLKQAGEEKDPARKIELLESAAKEPRISGELLATVFFETAMAYKDVKDYFHAIENLNYYLAYSRDTLPALLEKAHCLILLDQLDEASSVLEVVLATASTSARAYVLKGMIYEREGFLAKAEDEFSRALNFDPRSGEALEMRARVLLKQGKPHKALDDVNSLAKLFPEQPDVLLSRARISVKLKEYRAALVDYRRVESLMPGHDDVLKEKVQVFFRTDQPDKALEALSAYAAKHAEDAEVLVLKARANVLAKNYPEAQRVLKRALSINPLQPDAYLYTGVVLARARKVDEALSNLNRAIELDRTQVEAFKERARVFMELGEIGRAAADLTAATVLDPSDGEILALRGLTFMKRLLYDAAIADFTKALECLPGTPRILYDRAVAYVAKDENQLALADVEQVLQIRPHAARALSLRGIIQFNTGNMARAGEDLEKATEIDGIDPIVWNNRGFFLFKQGDYRAALACLKHALKHNPEYPQAKNNLSLVLQKMETLNLPEEIPLDRGRSAHYEGGSPHYGR